MFERGRPGVADVPEEVDEYDFEDGTYEDEPDEGSEGFYEAPRPARRRAELPARRRSHAAVPLAVVLLFAGLFLGTFSVLIPALLGIGLLYVALTFLSSRVNPFSIGFYLTVKPSWAAIGVVVLAGLLLIATAYTFYATGFGPIAPGFRHIP